LQRNKKGNDYLEDLGIDGRRVFEIYGGRVLSGFMGPVTGFC
jgi:hypothetical protein